MAKWRMAQIVAHGYGLCKAFIQPQGLCYGPGDLRHFQSVCQPGAVMISLRRQKHLGFMLQPSEGLAVKDPVTVPLVLRPYVAKGFFAFPPSGFS